MEPWKYDTAPDLEKPFDERIQSFPRRPEMSVHFVRSLLALAIRSWLRIYHRLTIRGREHLPIGRSFVLVANHASHLDAICLQASLPLAQVHHAYPAAAADYFFSSLPRSLVAAVAVNAMPFERKGGAEHSLEMAREVLQRPGQVLILFPEGTRSLDGTMARFRTGIARLVAGTDVPVVPCHLDGCHRAWPKGGWFPKPRKITLRIGAPRTFAECAADDVEALRGVAQTLQDDVAALAGSAR